MLYNNEYYLDREAKAYQSANRILDLLWEYYQPESVLDVGCATGVWLDVARSKGADRISGIDGPWVPKSELKFPASEFVECDLSMRIPDEVAQHDLTFCIEVAEHIPSAVSDDLISFLSRKSDVVVFSAAVPGQGGTGHVNEQMQSYWQRLFLKYGFGCFDLIRPRIWDENAVNVIYQQNLLVYARLGSSACGRILERTPGTEKVESTFELDRIHPELFAMKSRAQASGWRRGIQNRVKRVIKGSR